MTTKTILAISLLATATLIMTPITASALKEFNADVSVWDSSILPDITNGIFPIGGAGQIPGNFAVDTHTQKDTAIEVGLRAQQRLVGPIEPFGTTYFVPSGFNSPTRAVWNFDFSLDFGTSHLEQKLGKNLTPLNLKDHNAILTISDLDGNSLFAFDMDFIPSDPVVLEQGSWNTQFGFISVPQPDVGEESVAYVINLSVSDDKKTLAESEITVVVSDEFPVGEEVDVCHKGKSETVSAQAVVAHLKHGDAVGSC